MIIKNVVSLLTRTLSTDDRNNDRDHSNVDCVSSDEQRGVINLSDHDVTYSITEKE